MTNTAMNLLRENNCIPTVITFFLPQNSDPVRRQRGAHVEREEPWEHSFNFSIVLQPAILMFIEWCYLDVS